MKYKNYIFGLVVVITSFLLFAPQNKDWIDILGALGPVIVAGLVGYVAYRQYKIEEYKKRTMFYTEKMQALDDLYNLMNEALGISDEDLQHESESDKLKDFKLGNLLQKFYVLHLRFKTLFDNDKILELRKLFEGKYKAQLALIEYRKDTGHLREVQEQRKIEGEKENEMKNLHQQIQDEVLEKTSL